MEIATPEKRRFAATVLIVKVINCGHVDNSSLRYELSTGSTRSTTVADPEHNQVAMDSDIGSLN